MNEPIKNEWQTGQRSISCYEREIKDLKQQRNDLLTACELALAKFRLMYEKIEAGYDAEDLYTDSKSWPLTTLRNAIKKAK